MLHGASSSLKDLSRLRLPQASANNEATRRTIHQDGAWLGDDKGSEHSLFLRRLYGSMWGKPHVDEKLQENDVNCGLL